MNILIVTNAFFPIQNPRSFRATELAKEFIRQGHNVTVLTPEKKGIEVLLKEYSINYKSMGSLTWSIYNFKRLGKVGGIYNRLVNRLLPKLLEYPMIELFFKVKDFLNKETIQYDALISIAVPYPIHWGVAAAWKKGSNSNPAKFWIADCGDPYYIQENDTMGTPFYFAWIEKWFMRKVDFVTVPTDTAYKGYFEEFYNKLKVIPQGFKFEDVKTKVPKNDGVLRFGYGGGFAKWRRDPTGLLEYLITLDKSFKFEFHVYTEHRQFVEPFSKKDSRIIIHAPMERIALLETFSSFDFLVNFENKGSAQTPSKLIDYAIVQRPVLSLKSFDLSIDLIKQFMNKDYSNALTIENVDDYRIENVAKAFINLMQ